MKKFALILFVSVVFMSSLIIGCKTQQDKNKAIIGLSELQISACDSADAAGTCDTRLQEVGIVLKEECCKELGTCC